MCSRCRSLIREKTRRCFLSVCGRCFSFSIVSFGARKYIILRKFNLSVFVVVACAFCIMSKKSLPNPRSRIFTPTFSFWEFYSFSTYIEIFDPFWVHFCIGREVGVSVCSFSCGYEVVPAQSVERSLLSLCPGVLGRTRWTTGDEDSARAEFKHGESSRKSAISSFFKKLESLWTLVPNSSDH